MAIIKVLEFLRLNSKLLAMITITVILLYGLTVSKTATAIGSSSDVINSQFGSYLAGRQAQFDANSRFAINYYLSALEKTPKSILLHRQILTLLVSEGRIDEALPKAKRLLKLTRGSSNIAKLILILADVKDTHYLEAYESIDGLQEEGLNTYLLPMLKAWLLAGQNKNDAALRIIDKRTSNAGLQTLYGIQGAMISEFGNNTKDAIVRYKNVAKLQKNVNLRITILLGALYERLGQNVNAKKIYDNYRDLHPGTTTLDRAYKRLQAEEKPVPNNQTVSDGVAEALFSLGFAIQNQDPYQAIIFSRLAIYLRPSFTIAKLLLAGSLEDNDKLRDANNIYQSISKDPHYSWATRLRIANNLDGMGNTDDAIRDLRAMALEKTERSDALIKLGDILQKHKRYQASVNAYEQAKKRIQSINKKHWPLYFSLGISYERISKWPMAEKNLLKALELSPNHPSILNYLGYSWVEKGLYLDRAEKMIRDAVKQRPRDGYIIDSLGWALYRLGNFGGAVKQLERAVLIRPEDPTINDHLGDIYWSVGRKNEAIFQWNRALILEPEKEEVPKIELKLKVGLPKGINKSNGI